MTQKERNRLDLRNVLIVCLLLLVVSLSVFFYHCQKEKDYLTIAQERDSVIKRNNDLIAQQNEMYHYCMYLHGKCGDESDFSPTGFASLEE